MKINNLITATILATASFSFTNLVHAQTNLSTNIRQAVSAHPSESAAAIASLRNQGQKGIDVFFNTYKQQLSLQNAHAKKLNKTLDAICKQRDCYASRLYWYTDLSQAKAAAKATGKPILSLRLLGNLDEDLSCANSRFFRIALYPNTEISKVLREQFILHWESVRPVPKVTIDFGDGRKMQRTLTGNSIHYILAADGTPIDALPGLYSPQVFLKKLLQASDFVKDYSAKDSSEKPQFLKQYHSDRLAQIQKEWKADLSKLGISLPLPKIERRSANPTAVQAAPIAISKMAIERPILRVIAPNPQDVLETATTEDNWIKIAKLHRKETQLDRNSQTLMKMKNTQMFDNSNPEKLQQTVNNFELLITQDTFRNEYLLHSQLHQWFINKASTNDVNSLNDKVYAELFLTPKSDPWLGLLPTEGYTAIENDGISK